MHLKTLGLSLALACAGFRSATASSSMDTSTMMQLLPIAMKMVSTNQRTTLDSPEHEEVLKSILGPMKAESDPKGQSDTIYVVHTHPEEVTLSGDPDSQVDLIDEAVESAIALHLSEYDSIATDGIQACKRGSAGSVSCSQSAHKVAFRRLADKLIEYADQWKLQLDDDYHARYWELMQEAITKNIYALHHEKGLERLPDVSRYVRNKVRLKSLFGL